MEFINNDGPYSGLATPQGMLNFPDIVRFEDLESLPVSESELLFGVDGNGENVTVDLDTDSPHIIVSAGSGAGKSVIARSLATQGLLKGYSVVFLDVKRISHMWARNLPNTHLAVTANDIGNALVSVAMEVHRRMQVIEESPMGVEADVGPRILLVFEEMNTAIDTLKALDKQLPPRGVYKAMDAFGDIMNLGRAAGVHVIGFAQYADAQTVPTRWRESFGYRVLIRHSSNAWNMLAWQVGYCPPASRHPGRGNVVVGDRAVPTQFLYLTEEEAASLVRNAAVTVHGSTRRDMRRQARDARRALMAHRGVRV